MTRYARISCPGGIFHVISRIINDQYLIAGKVERNHYLSLLEKALGRTDAMILGWCLMSNHVHLVIKAGEDSLERLMKSVNTGFAMWLNRHVGGRKGAVFTERYKAILVEEEAYLLQLIRYVHNNPVRAGVVADAGNSDWSSHRAYLGLVPAPEWLKCGYVLSVLNRDPATGRQMFGEYVKAGRGEGRRKDLSGDQSSKAARRFQAAIGDGWRISGPLVGSDAFAAKVLADIKAVDAQVSEVGGKIKVGRGVERPSLDELIAVTCSVAGVEPWEFEQQPKRRKPALARRLITLLWVHRFKGGQIEIARKLNASTSAVSKWHGRAVEQMPQLDALCDQILEQFPTMLAGKDEKRKVLYGFEYED